MSAVEEREPAPAASSAAAGGGGAAAAAMMAASGPSEPLHPAQELNHPELEEGPSSKKRARLEAESVGGGGSAGGAAPGAKPGVEHKLEERLYSVLCCTVCLDLPKASVYQCTNGHLMCAGCFIHLLADARLKEEQATCPNCRCEISKSLCCRNLAVEKAVSELPSECGFCLKPFPRSILERHQKEDCQDRVTLCKYKRIGCPWQGPFHELTVHEGECGHPTKTGNELMEILDEMDQNHKKEMQLYNSIFNLLSFEKIGYTGTDFCSQTCHKKEVQFRPYRTDDFITRLYYETPRFTVLNQTWVLKARVNDSERNPNLSCKRTLSFQLILKSKVNSPMECSFLLLKGPYDDVKINPVIYHFAFTNENNETDYMPLPIIDSVECNKLLAAKNINLRLFIFQIQK
ncbi:cysteine and histidine-rich protein 1 isoform X1 [Scyliorhinus canicula]|uniref:cysteine and histidine-rich protein 1 isoform X1 n=1 Tax=Scyliorhinus canicula TaxID=7830 RepID=UPI0018F73C8E|nr:cysteine and histidine-rich protein 1 isoform X1 [Scyliorhinus canicula]